MATPVAVEAQGGMMKRDVSRRRMLGSAVVGVTGAAGLAVLAACGETQVVTVEKIVEKEVPVERIVQKEVPVERIVERIVQKEVPVERIVEKVVVREVMVEATPATRTVKIEFATDHTSGPRGKAMQWGIERWESQRPDVKIKFIPQDHIFYEKIAIEVAADTLSEINLLSGHSYGQFVASGAWLQVNDLLAKKADFVAEDYLFIPDVHSDNRDQGPYDKWTRAINGPNHGMPYQGDTRGIIYNIDAVAAAGANEPWEGMTWDDLLEEMKKVTDTEQGIWGSDSSISIALDCALGYNELQERVMGPDGHLIQGTFLDDGWMGLQYAVDLMFKHGVAFTAEERANVQGNLGSPFAAGKQVFWYGGRVYTTGFAVPRIKDRFRWSLGPPISGNGSGHPHMSHGDQPHIFASSAATTGVEEQTVDFGVYLAGPEVQGRVAIDRGSMPVHHSVRNQPEATAPPPEGMHHLYETYDSPYLMHAQWYVPGSPTALELWQTWHPLLGKALVGEATPTEAIEQADSAANAKLKNWQADLDAGRAPR